MGKREDYLKSILIERYGNGRHIKARKVNFSASRYYDEIVKIYQRLNGQLEVPPSNAGPWDIILPDFIVELDEERHFNSYRLVTLKSDIYKSWKFFNVNSYRTYCKMYEQDCLKAAGYGGYWCKPSSDKQFGPSGKDKDLQNLGSSRWRQRAFYDFLKDIFALITGVPVIRVSIYEPVNLVSVDELIKFGRKKDLIEHIEKMLKYNLRNIQL